MNATTSISQKIASGAIIVSVASISGKKAITFLTNLIRGKNMKQELRSITCRLERRLGVGKRKPKIFGKPRENINTFTVYKTMTFPATILIIQRTFTIASLFGGRRIVNTACG